MQEGGDAMADLITLEQFGATQRHYHIYKVRETKIAHLDHYHNYYQVCYVVSGEILHCQSNDAVTLCAGDAFIVPPGLTHSLHFKNAYAEIYSLAFDESLFAPGFPQSNAYQFLAGLQSKTAAPAHNSVRLCITLSRSQRKLIENLLACLIDQQQTDCPAGLSSAPSITAAIVYLLAQSYYQQPQNTSELDDLANYNSTLLQCVAYIDAHFRESISPAGLAKQFGISRSSFCTVFPQFVGMPLHKYIAQKMIKEAQILIRSCPEKSISQIATEVGYQDDSTFYRNFLRITGISPLKYKMNFRYRDSNGDGDERQ